MNDIYITAWDSLKKYIKDDKSLILKDKLQRKFIEDCETLHEKIKSEYMKSLSKESQDKIQLDRHKLAAVIAVSLSKGDYIDYVNTLEVGDIFFGKYLAAIYVACSLVEEDMNNDLDASRLKDEYGGIITLCLPEPVICDTKSANTLARMLIWEERKKVDDCIRVLELANTLFLIEQYTLLMNDIDMEKWKKYQKNKHKSI